MKKSVNKGTPKKTDGKNPLTLALSPRRGNKSTTILSTKKLTTAQKELLLNSGIGFIAYDAINIELLHVDVQDEIQNMIFTSKNAVKAVLNSEINVSNCFCVGENTKRLLEENGKKVIKTALNASDLANFIVKKHKNESFLFFCGNLRRKELPELLKDQKVALKEQIVYKTSLNSKKFNRSFDGILFFSPSGIQSYIKENTIGRSIVFCIGNTTASEAKKYTEHVVIANKPTVENVIVQAVKYFNQDLSSQT
ncbi:uroporphyrinogen-III synthase [Aquimarina celericrescens]|nr:uroporphyrinogen-III synthase [Aquimarina celericrescens]